MKATLIGTIFFLTMQTASVAGDLTGVVQTKGARDSRDVVVYLRDVPGEFSPPEEHARMDQKNLEFIPHVLPVLAGTTVDFFNSDDVLHNVFTPNNTFDRFNLGSWPKGEVRSYTFEAECEIVCAPILLCNVHPEMEAFVIVLENPYFAVTDRTGEFTIEDVPAGEYEVGLWHEKLEGEGSHVSVPDTGSVSLNLTMHR